MPEYFVIGAVVAAFIVAGVLSYLFTPPVKKFAHKVGAIDVPKDNRRMHKEPIPRLGGLAIFGGFLCSILIFGQLDQTMLCVLLGATIIVALGIFDDVLALGAKLKFVVQIAAAAIPVCIGDLRIELFTNLNPFSDAPYFHLGIFAIPVTIIWIVGITNAVNLIDGLDGLAVGVSSIAAIIHAGGRAADREYGDRRYNGGACWRVHRLYAVQSQPREDLYGRYRLDLSGVYAGDRVHHGPVQILRGHLVCRAVPDPGLADFRHC